MHSQNEHVIAHEHEHELALQKKTLFRNKIEYPYISDDVALLRSLIKA